jgi:iron complex outermembrane receptor protein
VISPIDQSSSKREQLPAERLGGDRLAREPAVAPLVRQDPDLSGLRIAESGAVADSADGERAGHRLGRQPEPASDASKNIDATLEYYFPKNGYAQIALFHRDIDGYLQNMESNETIGGLNYRVTRPQNSGSGTLKGAELGIQKFFDFLPGIWSNFGAQANYTWITGENQTLVSPTGNDYHDDAADERGEEELQLRAAVRGQRHHRAPDGHPPRRLRRADRRAALRPGPPRQGRDLRRPEPVVRDHKNISLQFDAINITREKFESYLNDPIRPRDIRYNPTTYGLGLRFSL